MPDKGYEWLLTLILLSWCANFLIHNHLDHKIELLEQQLNQVREDLSYE
jgi:hypothetical protein